MSLHLPRPFSLFAEDEPKPRREHLPERPLREYAQMLVAEAYDADVPATLLQALCWHASGWRQFAPDGAPLMTPGRNGNSWGAMQLSEVWHPDAFPAARTDAMANIRYAARLLRWLYEQTGDWRRAAVAFFGHDRRAELAARRVMKAAHTEPWRGHPGLAEAEPAPPQHAAEFR